MSSRRGVHHSGGLRAKRRWLAWRRYQRRCDALAGHGNGVFACRIPPGYYRAFSRYTYVGRYAPIGIRDVRS